MELSWFAQSPYSSRKHRRNRPRRTKKWEFEILESRNLLATWTPLTNLVPDASGAQSLMLLSDGTVMVQGGNDSASKNWYRLTSNSAGSFINGTFSSLTSMNLERLFFASNILASGKVFVLGGEYSGPATTNNWINSGEIYDPVANTWSAIPNFPQTQFGDDPTTILPNGNLLVGYLSGPQTYIFNTSTLTWSTGATKLRNDQSDEETWVKLPDGSVLSYDIFNSVSTGTGTAQRYVPSTNTWVDAGTVPVTLTSSALGYELGPAFLLPDGRVWQIGANSNTAFYTPSTNKWVAGPIIPNAKGADDAPGAIMPNGHVLFAADAPQFKAPTQLFDFDPIANTITQVATPTALTTALNKGSFLERMLMLPNGDVMMSTSTKQLWEFTPDGSANASWKPTISSVVPNGGNTYTLTGTQLNGISEGASYGDDAEMSSNYPIVLITHANGSVAYARTYNWSNTGVATGSTVITTQFSFPISLVGSDTITVIANGIASTPMSYNFSVLSSTPAASQVLTGTAPTDFNIQLNLPPTSILANVLKVNGIPADSYTFNSTTNTITFHFNVSPVTTQGLQSMAIATGALTSGGNLIQAFSASFYYTTTRLAVTSTTPINGGSITLSGTLSYTVNFNQPVLPSSVSTSSLTLSGITGIVVSSAVVQPGNTSVIFTLSGAISEGTLLTSIAVGGIVDVNGVPILAYTGSLTVDFGIVPFPVPLTPVLPSGSLVYNASLSGLISPVGDTDSFTINLDAGQKISVILKQTATNLQGTLQILNPASVVSANTIATGIGQDVLINNFTAVSTGLYTIVVSGANGTSGAYTLTVDANAQEELESHNGPTNNSFATAENIDSSFLSLGGAATRGAVLGQTATDFNGNLLTFEAGLGGYTINNSTVGTGTSAGLWHLTQRRSTDIGHSATTSFYYGSESNGNYDTGARNGGSITSPTFAVPTGTPTLSFNYLLLTEGNSIFDTALVQISANGFSTFTTLLTSTNSSSLPLSNTWKSASTSLSSFAGQNVQVRFIFDTVDASLNTYEGWYVDDVAVSIGAVTPPADYYSFTLNSGDTASLALKGVTATGVSMTLYDPSGSIVTSGDTGATNADNLIRDFKALTAGLYRVMVTANTTMNYDLVVTRLASLDFEPNNSLANAEPLLSKVVAGTQQVLGSVESGGFDLYAVNLAQGVNFQASATTPTSSVGLWNNMLDPRLRLLNSSGVAVAVDDNSASDGKNALLNYTVPTAGTYYVEVSSTLANSTTGEYVLNVTGNTVTLPVFQVTSSSIPNGTSLRVATSVTLVFNQPLLQTSILASNFKIDGVSATSFTIVNSQSVTFNFSSLSNGIHTFTIAAGALTDVEGAGIAAYSSTVTIDNIAPKITATSLAPNGIATPGTLSYQVTFNKPMLTANLTTSIFSLKGNLRNVSYTASTYSFDASGKILTLNYINLPDDNYTLTLTAGTSGSIFFTDTLGNALDGEFSGTFPSGNNAAGGDFVIGFNLDISTEALTSFVSELPAGSLIYDQSLTRTIPLAGFSESFTLAADAGQSLSVIVTPSTSTYTPSITILAPNNNVLGTATATVAGVRVLLNNTIINTSGIYKIVVSGAGTTTGLYTIKAELNAALETENLDGSNNTAANAQNLNSAFSNLQAGTVQASRTAVVGKTDYVVYSAAAATTFFQDISTTGTIDTIATGSFGSHNLTATQLGTFTFPFFGTTYNNLYINTDGTITFTVNETSWSYSDLSTTPAEPIISVLWGDLQNNNTGTGTTAQQIFYQVVGSGTNQQLIVQWNNTYDWNIFANVTFQAILSQNGTIQLNYTSSVTTAAFVQTTVGVKAAGTANPQHLVIDYAGTQPLGTLVSPSSSVVISPINPGPDYYSFSATAGQTATIGVVGLITGTLTLDLIGPDGSTVLTSGTASATNFSEIINNYVTATTGTYYVRVFGAGISINYDLVITKNAVFDAENNATSATAQNVGSSQGALGSITSTTPDWYAVTIQPGLMALQLDTSTPADGANQFNNTLDPKIDLYNTSGTLLKSGIVQGDGRNETLFINNLTTGNTYWIRVSAQNSTAGEYFLGIAYTQSNIPPIINSIINTGPINENGQATITVNATDPDLTTGGLNYQFDADNNGIYELSNSTGVASFSFGEEGSYPVKILVSDSAGGSVQGAATVVVNAIAPTGFSGPSSIVEGSTYNLTLGTDTDQDPVTAGTIDWGDGTFKTFTSSPILNQLQHTYANGPNTYTIKASSITDEDGTFTNVSILSVTVNNAPPIVTNLGDVNAALGQTAVNTGSWSDPGSLDTVALTASIGSVIENSNGAWTWNSGTAFTSLGSIPVTITATDNDGASSSTTFNVKVLNLSPPTILGIPANLSVEATGPTGALVSYVMPTATDTIDGTILVTSDFNPGSLFPLGKTIVHFTATDSLGIIGTASFTVLVLDTTAPTLTLPLNPNFEATSSAGATAAGVFSASASDAVTASPTITYFVGTTPISNSYVFPLGATTVNVTAKDSANNVATGSINVLIVDTTPPVLILPADQSVAALSSAGVTDPAAFTATATDIVSANPTITYYVAGSPVANDFVFPVGTTIVNVSATDAVGNLTTGSFTVQTLTSTTTTLTPSASTIVYGQTVLLTATTSALFSSSATPSGSVTFYENGTKLGTVALNGIIGNDQAIWNTSILTVGMHNFSAVYSGDTTFFTSSSITSVTVFQTSPTVNAIDAGGVYNGSPFPGTATVKGIGTVASSTLEGIGLTLTYYAGGTLLSGAPSTVGTYTILASFAGSTSYTSANNTATFTIIQATPTVTVTDAGGIYNGSPYPAAATVKGVSGNASSSLEGVAPNLVYYAGASATGTPLSGAPINTGTYTVKAIFAGSTDSVVSGPG